MTVGIVALNVLELMVTILPSTVTVTEPLRLELSLICVASFAAIALKADAELLSPYRGPISTSNSMLSM